MTKAVGLISGGLDSILAIKMVQEQNIEVIGVCFVSVFFDNSTYVKKIAEELKLKLQIIYFDDEYINLIQKPKYGYGKAINPCIDCHIYMLKKAKELMHKHSAEFVFTGEVLGERPMSQNAQALKNIERESGLKGYLLRPLSAQLLEPTIPEIKGLIDRTKLGKISGRSRKPQLELAQKYEIKDIPQPAGGCLLTEQNFGLRLKDAFRHNETTINELELLKLGRHFRLHDGIKIIVGRNEKENKQIKKLSQSNDIILQPVDTVGPIVLIKAGQRLSSAQLAEIIKIAAGLCARYSDKNNSNLVKVKYNDIIIEAEPLDESLIIKFRI